MNIITFFFYIIFKNFSPQESYCLYRPFAVHCASLFRCFFAQIIRGTFPVLPMSFHTAKKLKTSPPTAVLCIISLYGGYAPAKLSQLSGDSVHRVSRGDRCRMPFSNSDSGRGREQHDVYVCVRWISNYPEIARRETTDTVRPLPVRCSVWKLYYAGTHNIYLSEMMHFKRETNGKEEGALADAYKGDISRASPSTGSAFTHAGVRFIVTRVQQDRPYTRGSSRVYNRAWEEIFFRWFNIERE